MMALTSRTVTGTYQRTDGTPTSGEVWFTPNVPSSSALEDLILPTLKVRAQLDDDGSFSASLVCTDNPGLLPSGWAYTVTECIHGASPNRSYLISVPSGAGDLDLADVAPLETPPTTVQYVLLSGATMTGPLILSGDPATGLGAATKQYVDAGDALAEKTANKGAASGYASLDSSTLVPASQMRSFNYRGVLQASTAYNKWDVLVYRGRRILVTSPFTSGTITSDIDESKFMDFDGDRIIYAYDYGFRTNGDPASAAANTTALQNAINDAAALTSACVVLPPGFGFIASPGIELKSRVHLKGAGQFSTILQLAPDSNCHMVYPHRSTNGTSDPNAVWCTISDLTLDGRATTQSGAGPYYGIYCSTNPLSTAASADQAHDPSHLIQNVHVRNAKDAGIWIEGRSDIRLVNCKVSFSGGDNYRLSFDTVAIGCLSEKPAKAGFVIAGSSTRLLGCKSYLAGQGSQGASRPAVPASGHGYVVDGSIGEIGLTGCDAQQNSGHGFLLAGGVNAVVLSGCTVQEASFGQATTYSAFKLDNATACVVQGASKAATGVTALSLTGGATRSDISIGHTSMPSQTAGAVLAAGSTILANRVTANGVDLSGSNVARAWTSSTSYLTGDLVSRYGMTYRVTADHTSGASFSLANLAMLSAPLPATIIPSGKYAFAGGGHSSSTGQTGTGTLRAYPVYIPHDVILTRIGAEVTTVGDAGSKVRLAIFADTGEFQPGTLILDAGQINGDSAIVQEITINQPLTAGVYWVGAVTQTVTTTQPTLRTTGASSYALPMTSAPTAGLSAAGYTHGVSVTGAAPAVFSIGGQVGVIPRIHLKA